MKALSFCEDLVSVRSAFDRLPDKVEEPYFDMSMDRISNQSTEQSTLAKHVLSCLFLTKKFENKGSLTIEELGRIHVTANNTAAAAAPATDEIQLAGIENIDTVLEVTKGLCKVDKEKKRVELFHRSLYSYFEKHPAQIWVITREYLEEQRMKEETMKEILEIFLD